MRSSAFPEGDGNTVSASSLVYPDPELRACAVGMRRLQLACCAYSVGTANQCAKRNGFLYWNAVLLLKGNRILNIPSKFKLLRVSM